MSAPLVTVCIVTCNQVAYIEHCVRSVLEQETDADLNILIGDDASDDGTSEIIAALAAANPGVVTHLRRAERIGAFANMRNLIALAGGDFIARVDGDDYWLPGKLQRQLDYLLENPGCAAVYTNAITMSADGRRIGIFNDVGDARFDLGAILRRGNFLNNSSVLFRANGRHAWLDVEVSQIDYRIHLWHARHGWLGHIKEPLAVYRVNVAGSAVATMNDRVRELYWEAIQSVPRQLISDLDYAKGLANFLRRVALRAARLGRWKLLLEWAERVVSASPYGAFHTIALTSFDVVRISLCLAWGWVSGSKRVLYRR